MTVTLTSNLKNPEGTSRYLSRYWNWWGTEILSTFPLQPQQNEIRNENTSSTDTIK